MNPRVDPAEEAALDWIIRMDDPDFDQWDDWEAWLARDESHGPLYWRLAADQAELSERLKRAAPVEPVRPLASTSPTPLRPARQPITRRAAPLAIAAAVALAVGVGVLVLPRPTTNSSFQTAASERREVTLADGSRVHLHGGTRIEASADGRTITLAAGRALFEVAPGNRPFTVSVGEARVIDLGTAFDVTRLRDGVRVEVSQGHVRYEAGGRTEDLHAGQGLTATNGGVRRRDIETAEVAAWRADRLSYRAETLAVIAEDLSRELDRPVQVAAPLANRLFSGSLSTASATPELKARLETMLGVSIREDGRTWRLEAPDGA